MSADLSSSDEETKRLKAAIDANFFTENLYKQDVADASNKVSTEELKTLPSLRNQNREIVAINPYTIKVSPDFQKHISKHLTRILDGLIDDTESFLILKKVKKKRTGGGIRLLRNSNNHVVVDSNCKKNVLKKKFVNKNDSYDSDIEKRCKEVAVTPEWVLTQEETKNWEPNTKGEVEVVKLDANKRILESKKKRKRKKKHADT